MKRKMREKEIANKNRDKWFINEIKMNVILCKET